VAKDRRYQWWSASAMSARYCAMRTGRSVAGRVVPSRVCSIPRRPSGPVTTVVPVGLVVTWGRRVLPWDCHGARSRVHPNLIRILAPPCPTDDDSSRAAGFRQTSFSKTGYYERRAQNDADLLMSDIYCSVRPNHTDYGQIGIMAAIKVEMRPLQALALVNWLNGSLKTFT